MTDKLRDPAAHGEWCKHSYGCTQPEVCPVRIEHRIAPHDGHGFNERSILDPKERDFFSRVDALIAEVDDVLSAPGLDVGARIVDLCSKYRPAVMLSAIVRLRSQARRT